MKTYKDTDNPLYQPWSERDFRADFNASRLDWLQNYMYRALCQAAFVCDTRPYLPDDDEQLWVLAACRDRQQWDENKIHVRAMFTALTRKDKSLLGRKRIVEDWKKLVEKRRAQREGGQIGGKKARHAQKKNQDDNQDGDSGNQDVNEESWGGKRLGSGRPPKSQKSQEDKTQVHLEVSSSQPQPVELREVEARKVEVSEVKGSGEKNLPPPQTPPKQIEEDEDEDVPSPNSSPEPNGKTHGQESINSLSKQFHHDTCGVFFNVGENDRERLEHLAHQHGIELLKKGLEIFTAGIQEWDGIRKPASLFISRWSELLPLAEESLEGEARCAAERLAWLATRTVPVGTP